MTRQRIIIDFSVRKAQFSITLPLVTRFWQILSEYFHLGKILSGLEITIIDLYFANVEP